MWREDGPKGFLLYEGAFFTFLKETEGGLGGYDQDVDFHLRLLSHRLWNYGYGRTTFTYSTKRFQLS